MFSDQPVAPKPVNVIKPDVSDIKPPVIPLERESKILMREPVQETKSKPGEGQKISKGTRKEMEKEQADCFVTDDKVSDRAGLNPTNMKYGSTIFADLESSGSVWKCLLYHCNISKHVCKENFAKGTPKCSNTRLPVNN